MTETQQKIYTTELSKGQGMVPETVAILDLWEPGMTTVELKQKVKEQGILGRATSLRTDDLVGRPFAHRYLSGDPPPAAWLKRLLEKGVSPSKVTQILLIYTSRANVVLHDFITEVYWPRYAAGATKIARQDAVDFLERATQQGFIPRRWSETVMLRMARYLTGSLTDFGLAGVDRGGKRELVSFTIASLTTAWLAHELHFTGAGDNAILTHPDWRLFGLEPRDTVQELKRVQNPANFIVQYSGDLLRISWSYSSMEQYIDDIAQQGL